MGLRHFGHRLRRLGERWYGDDVIFPYLDRVPDYVVS